MLTPGLGWASLWNQESQCLGLREAPIHEVCKLSTGPHPFPQTYHLEHQDLKQSDMKSWLEQGDASAAWAPSALLSTSGKPWPTASPTSHTGTLSPSRSNDLLKGKGAQHCRVLATTQASHASATRSPALGEPSVPRETSTGSQSCPAQSPLSTGVSRQGDIPGNRRERQGLLCPSFMHVVLWKARPRISHVLNLS